MKTKAFITLGLLVGLFSLPVNAQGIFIPSGVKAMPMMGRTVFWPNGHSPTNCSGTIGFSCMDIPGVWSMWLDPLMIIATGIDIAATKKHAKITVDAKNAIDKLEKALKPYDETACWVSLALDDSVSAVYTTENIQAMINVKETKWDVLFTAVRDEIEKYLFETPDGQIRGACTGSDRDCAVERQNEWLVASTTLASATADKVLDKTARGGTSSLEDHFKDLTDQFNKKKTPFEMYTAMAEIVLDTHKQMNETNTLLGRDLEAQGLSVVRETSPVFFQHPETEE